MDTGLITRKNPVLLAAKIIVPVILALISIFVIAPRVSSADFYTKTLSSLERVRRVVLGLTGASTAASAAITLLPDDICSPIATQLMELTENFMIILCAVYFEKFMLTVIGYFSFTFVIPAGMGLSAVNALFKNEQLRTLSVKLCVFGLCAFLVIPVSVKVSDLINEAHRESIEATISAAEESVAEIESASGNVETEETQSEKKNVFQRLFDAVESGVGTITQSVSLVTEKLKGIVDNFVDALAVLIVTSCVIPIAIIAIFVWLVKTLFHLDLKLPERHRARRHEERDDGFDSY